MSDASEKRRYVVGGACACCRKDLVAYLFGFNRDPTFTDRFKTVYQACNPDCIEKFMRSKRLIDPSPAERSAVMQAKKLAAEYLMANGLINRPLSTFSPQEVEQFLFVIIGGYLEARIPDDEIPF